jgi:hypothetical protein
MSIILYSLVFAGGHGKHPVPSGSGWLTGTTSASTGLSRSFSEIVLLDFKEARTYNPHGIRIFAFFMLQLLLRIATLVLIPRINLRHVRQLAMYDAMLSTMVFVICFWPFLSALFQQLNNT